MAVAKTKARPVHCKYADQEMGTLAEVAEEVHIFARTRTRPSYREGNEGEGACDLARSQVEGGPYFRYDCPYGTTPLARGTSGSGATCIG